MEGGNSNYKKVTPEERAIVELAFNMQGYIVKNTLLRAIFSAIFAGWFISVVVHRYVNFSLANWNFHHNISKISFINNTWYT